MQRVKPPLANSNIPYQFLAVPLPIQLPVNVLEKASVDDLNSWGLATYVGTKMEFWTLSFKLAQTWMLWPFRK